MTSRVGVIADTHGLLRPEAVAALRGVDLIIHAGDVGDPALLPFLKLLAPLVVVRGNVDCGTWADAWPETDIVSIGGASIYVLHDLATLSVDPVEANFHAVIFGHSHQPRVERRGRVLYVNPGSAGPRRFTLPVTVARLTIEAGHVEGSIVPLDIAT